MYKSSQLLISSALVLLMSNHAIAQSNAASSVATPVAYIENVSPTERINFSGKLRMLSQRIPSAACHLAAGVDPEGSRALLAGAKSEFSNILGALEFGDAELGVNGAETRRLTLAKIHELNAHWSLYQTTIDQVLAGDTDGALIKSLLGDSMTILESAKLLVSEISGQYSNPAEMTQSGAMVIDIAGRQRMLTQKMSKEACAAWSGFSDTAASDLAGTMNIFESSLNALIHGMPAAGIKKPSTPEIAEGLNGVANDWKGVKEALASISSGAKPDAAEATRIFQHLNKTMANMNKVVGMYSEAEKIEL